MTNKQVAERFAAIYSTGKSNNMFIDGLTIYSYGYHFPIAKRISSNEFFFTNASYSQATSRHKNLVMNALKEIGAKITITDPSNLK